MGSEQGGKGERQKKEWVKVGRASKNKTQGKSGRKGEKRPILDQGQVVLHNSFIFLYFVPNSFHWHFATVLSFFLSVLPLHYRCLQAF